MGPSDTIDAFVIDAVRTPMGRYRGALAGVRPDDLAAHVIAAAVERTGVDPSEVRDVYLGAANQAGEDNRDAARMAALLAGLPVEVPGVTVNRLCASGLEAVNQASRALRLGEGDLYLAGGAESMSRAPWVVPKPERRACREGRRRCTTRRSAGASSTRGWPSATRPSRWARRPRTWPSATASLARSRTGSRSKATPGLWPRPARAGSRTSSSPSRRRRPTAGDGPVMVGDRRGPSRRHLAREARRLRPAFRDGGTVTAGNASTLNDGAACLVLATGERAEALGARPLARIVSIGVAGVDPAYMGMGPVPAIRRALDGAGLSARRHRPGRDQRGVRRPGPRLRRRAGDRGGPPERQRRRDRARASPRLLRAPASSPRSCGRCGGAGCATASPRSAWASGQGVATIVENPEAPDHQRR